MNGESAHMIFSCQNEVLTKVEKVEYIKNFLATFLSSNLCWHWSANIANANANILDYALFLLPTKYATTNIPAIAKRTSNPGGLGVGDEIGAGEGIGVSFSGDGTSFGVGVRDEIIKGVGVGVGVGEGVSKGVGV